MGVVISVNGSDALQGGHHLHWQSEGIKASKISVYSVRQEQYVRALLYSFFYCYNYNNIIDTVIKSNINNGL